ncbi:hypothetical protein WJX84_003006 [Apatococcus fuscideae]|uniref:Hedgehog protein Hint domain-containing protein n=1 Tax=Apatococcus fuscideae TaxID=2026836 RepID=A0AAW1TDC4_9CHLO
MRVCQYAQGVSAGSKSKVSGATSSRRVRSAPPTSQASCFPGDATVQTPQGRRLMRDLSLGDQVLTADPFGRQEYETIFMFTHFSKEPATHVTLTTQRSYSLSLTAGHYIWAALVPSPGVEAK